MKLLLYSEDRYTLLGAKKKVMAEFLKKVNCGFVTSFDAFEADKNQIIDALLGASLFAEKSLVVIENLLDSKYAQAIFDIFPNVPETTSVILIEEKAKSKINLPKGIDLTLKSVQAKEISVSAIAGKLKAAGLSSLEIAAFLKFAKKDRWWFQSESAKIELAVEAGVKVTDIIGVNTEATIFKLADYWLDRKIANLVREYLRLEMEPPEKLLGWLGKIALQMVLLTVNVKAVEAGIPPFAAAKRAQQSKILGAQKAKEIHKEITNLDYKIKTGQVQKDAILLFLLKPI